MAAKMKDISAQLFDTLRTADADELAKLADLVSSWRTTYSRSARAMPPAMADLLDAIIDAHTFTK